MSRKQKLLLVTVGTLTVALIVVILVFKSWSHHASKGTVHVGKPAAQTLPEPPKEPLAIQTDYFTAQLPADFRITRQTNKPNDTTLLQFVANNKHQQFAVTVGTLPSEGLVGVGDFYTRVRQTDAYEPYRPAGMPVAATAFKALDGSPAFVAFWPHGTQYVEIALSSDGGATLSQLFDTFEQATHNWQWK